MRRAGGFADARLQAHRRYLRDGAEALLRANAHAWSGPGLDEAGRAVAAICVPLPAFAPVPPSLPTDPAAAFTDICAATELTPAEEAVVAAVWWAAVDPAVRVLFGALHDDSSRRFVSLAALRTAVAPLGFDVPLALGPGDRLVDSGFVDPVADPSAPVVLLDAALRLLAGWQPEVPTEPHLVDRLLPAAAALQAHVEAGRRVVVRAGNVQDARRVLTAAGAATRTAIGADVPDSARLLVTLGLLLPVRTERRPSPGRDEDGPGLGDDAAPAPVDPSGPQVALADAFAAVPPGWSAVDVPALEPPALTAAWDGALRTAGLDRSAAPDLAARHRLTEAEAVELVEAAVAEARLLGRPVSVSDVVRTVRHSARHALAGLARPLPTSTRLADLVLPEHTRRSLDLLLAHARWSAGITATWTTARGRGVVALLHGPSGTGKTAAAEALGTELERDVWVVELGEVVSKWLGETQRNLDRVLTEGARAGAVLLFDEADGLFGRRGEVTDARDRYANLEIDHLLQRIELHEGIVLLTSNRPAALDDAFARRLRLRVRFDLPDHPQRAALWTRFLPPRCVDPGVDPADLARTELSGGAICAAALTARVLAAAEGTRVGWPQLEAAIGAELDKHGRRREPRAVLARAVIS